MTSGVATGGRRGRLAPGGTFVWAAKGRKGAAKRKKKEEKGRKKEEKEVAKRKKREKIEKRKRKRTEKKLLCPYGFPNACQLSQRAM